MKLKIKVRVFKERKYWIVYSKKYRITGYGNTRKEARKMFKEVALGIFEYTK